MGTPTGDGALRALTGKTSLAQVASGRLTTDAGLAVFHEFPRFREPFTGEPKYDLMSFSAQPNSLLDGPFTDRGLSALAGLEGLVGVNLFWHTPAFTPAGLAAFAEFQTSPSLVATASGPPTRRCGKSRVSRGFVC